MKYDAKSFNPNKTLKRVREQRTGMSQSEFAKEIGITVDKLKRIENRKEKTGISILEYLEWCDNFGCDIDFLLGVQEHPIKDDADICGLTGLDAYTIDVLKKEMVQPPVSNVRSGKSAVISGITTADIFNGLVGIKGCHLKDAIHQYVREKMVTSLLDESVENIVQYHNKENDRNDSKQSVIAYANSVLTNLRMLTSLSSLTMTGRVQKGIADDFTNFCKKMNAEGYDKTECRIIFDYLQSGNRTEALRMNCYDLLMQFLDEIAEDSQLKYHSRMGDFDVTATMLYEESIDAIEESKTELLASSVKKEMTRLKSSVRELMAVNQKLLNDNNMLSAELSETRWNTEALQKELDRIKGDTESEK